MHKRKHDVRLEKSGDTEKFPSTSYENTINSLTENSQEAEIFNIFYLVLDDQRQASRTVVRDDENTRIDNWRPHIQCDAYQIKLKQ
jgi:hypothetical protein